MSIKERRATFWRFDLPAKISFLLMPALLIVLFGLFSHGQANDKYYPKKRIVWLVPYQPGGGYDTYSRAIAKTLPKYLPRSVNVIVKNMPGAGGRRGAAVLYRSESDGYTIGILNPVGLMASDLVKKSTQYDLLKFTYLATCSRGVAGLYVGAHSKYKSLEDMQRAERVTLATGGRGSATWLWGMLVKRIMNVPVHMVSGYLGTSEYAVALIRKDADALATGFSNTLLSYCKAGEIRPIVIFLREPWEFLPEVPTLAGTPYEEMSDFPNDRVIAGPPGLSAEIAEILEKAIVSTLDDPDLKEWSRKTESPFFIRNSKDTLADIKKGVGIIKKYESFFLRE